MPIGSEDFAHFFDMVAHLHLLLVQHEGLGQFECVGDLVHSFDTNVCFIEFVLRLSIEGAFCQVEDLVGLLLHPGGEFNAAWNRLQVLHNFTSVGIAVDDCINGDQPAFIAGHIDELGQELGSKEFERWIDPFTALIFINIDKDHIKLISVDALHKVIGIRINRINLRVILSIETKVIPASQ